MSRGVVGFIGWDCCGECAFNEGGCDVRVSDFVIEDERVYCEWYEEIEEPEEDEDYDEDEEQIPIVEVPKTNQLDDVANVQWI